MESPGSRETDLHAQQCLVSFFPSFWLFQHGCSSIGWINIVFIEGVATVKINELEQYLYTYISYINMDKPQHWSGKKASCRICTT